MNKVEQLSMLYNQAHALTTALQTELVLTYEDRKDHLAWYGDQYPEAKHAFDDRIKRLRSLVKVAQSRRKRRELALNKSIGVS